MNFFKRILAINNVLLLWVFKILNKWLICCNYGSAFFFRLFFQRLIGSFTTFKHHGTPVKNIASNFFLSAITFEHSPEYFWKMILIITMSIIFSVLLRWIFKNYTYNDPADEALFIIIASGLNYRWHYSYLINLAHLKNVNSLKNYFKFFSYYGFSIGRNEWNRLHFILEWLFPSWFLPRALNLISEEFEVKFFNSCYSGFPKSRPMASPKLPTVAEVGIWEFLLSHFDLLLRYCFNASFKKNLRPYQENVVVFPININITFVVRSLDGVPYIWVLDERGIVIRTEGGVSVASINEKTVGMHCTNPVAQSGSFPGMAVMALFLPIEELKKRINSEILRGGNKI